MNWYCLFGFAVSFIAGAITAVVMIYLIGRVLEARQDKHIEEIEY